MTFGEIGELIYQPFLGFCKSLKLISKDGIIYFRFRKSLNRTVFNTFSLLCVSSYGMSVQKQCVMTFKVSSLN